MKEKIYALIPNIFIFLAAFALFFSGLSLEKAIYLESQAFSKFLKDLSQNFFYALFELVETIFYEAVIPLLPFLCLSAIGFSSILLFKEIDFSFLMLIQAIFFAIFLLINLSLISVFVYLGMIAGTLSIKNLKREISFSSGISIKNSLKWISTFVSIGFFLTLQLNLENYHQAIYKSNMDFIKTFVPDVESLIEFQTTQASSFINQTTEGIKNALSDAYSKLDLTQRQTCNAMYTALVSAVDTYKEEANKKLQEEVKDSDRRIEEYVEQVIPFDQLIKLTPLLLAILLFTLLEIIRPFLSIFFGLIFSLVGKLIK